MSATWNCDICGKETHVAAPAEPIWVDEQVQVPNSALTLTRKVPLMTTMQRQDLFTGEVKEIKVPRVKFLSPKAFIVMVQVGDETLQRDFCEECLATLKPEIDALWAKLKTTKSV